MWKKDCGLEEVVEGERHFELVKDLSHGLSAQKVYRIWLSRKTVNKQHYDNLRPSNENPITISTAAPVSRRPSYGTEAEEPVDLWSCFAILGSELLEMSGKRLLQRLLQDEAEHQSKSSMGYDSYFVESRRLGRGEDA